MQTSNLKRAVITPTFAGHFEYAINLLKSFDKFVKDKGEIDYVFILSSQQEQNDFVHILDEKYTKAPWFKVANIESILSEYGISESTEHMIKNVGRFSYQTIKKLYGMLYFDYDQYFVLDSESLFLKSIKMSELFNRFFKDKFIFYCPTNAHKQPEYTQWLDYKTSIHCAELLNFHFDNNWYFETFYWFYDINIIKDLFKHFNNNLFKAISDFSGSQTEEFEKAIFEIILYNQFIKNNNNRYKYNFIDVNAELIRVLGNAKYNKMRKLMESVNQGMFPYFIHGWEYLRFYDLIKISKIYKKYHIPMARLFFIGCIPKKTVISAFINFTNIKIATATDGVSVCYKIINISLIRRIFLKIGLFFRFITNPKNRK